MNMACSGNGRPAVAAILLSGFLLTLTLIYTRQVSTDDGHSVLDENGSNVHGGPGLQHKNMDALNILDHFFGSKAHSKHEAHKVAAKKALALKYSEHRGRATSKSSSPIPPIPPPPHLLGPLPGEGGPMGAGGPPNPVEAGMNEVLGGWSGAGWWQPCSEVCTAGRSRAEMKKVESFKQFQACESKCRATKAKELKNVIAHVKAMVGAEAQGPGGPHAMPPPHMLAHRLSKHLVKWAETQGLPKKLADNPKDAAQVGQSVTGMLIAAWSQAGWWKPCGEVCHNPNVKSFKQFMACEQTCQDIKSQLIESTMDPKTFGAPTTPTTPTTPHTAPAAAHTTAAAASSAAAAPAKA